LYASLPCLQFAPLPFSTPTLPDNVGEPYQGNAEQDFRPPTQFFLPCHDAPLVAAEPGHYFETLKSDSHAEHSFLQFFFYTKNLAGTASN
jgi:hypothetical protein